MFKRVLTVIIALTMIAMMSTGMTAAADEAVEEDYVNYLWEIPEDASEEQYIQLMERNFRIIQEFELLFTPESYKEFANVYKKQYKKSQQ